MKTMAFALMVTGIFFICFSIALIKDSIKAAVLPDGYSILCSVPPGKFSIIDPDGYTFPSVWGSEKGAKDFAVYYESRNYEPIVRDVEKYTWEACE